MRYEGAFRARYVAPLGLPPTEEIARSISWGLMQVMGQVAREHGFTELFLSSLCEPATGISVGCVVLASKFAAAGREVGAGNLSGSKVGCMSACRTASLGCITIGSAGGGSVAEAAQGALSTSDRALWRRALQLWNGGANPEYPTQVLARVAKYR